MTSSFHHQIKKEAVQSFYLMLKSVVKSCIFPEKKSKVMSAVDLQNLENAEFKEAFDYFDKVK